MMMMMMIQHVDIIAYHPIVQIIWGNKEQKQNTGTYIYMGHIYDNIFICTSV
jgi:hypothetical protein